jgi:hypothetical protein
MNEVTLDPNCCGPRFILGRLVADESASAGVGNDAVGMVTLPRVMSPRAGSSAGIAARSSAHAG